jgi:hypothetical protein
MFKNLPGIYAEELTAKFGAEGDTFEAQPGRRYARIVRRDKWGSGSAYAFVDITSGALLKAAGWKAPAKGVRFDLSTPEGLTEAVKAADRFGGHLYAR